MDALQDHQLKKLKELLEYAYAHSEHYRRKYDAANFSPSDIRSLDDLKRIPILTKHELLENSSGIQIRTGPEKLFYSETSGSTGKPLVFFRNKDWDAWHRASAYRGYSWYGAKPWEYNGYFWGYDFSYKNRMKTKVLDFLQNRFRLFTYQNEEISQFVQKLKRASFLSGYSSMIYEVAKSINKIPNKPEFHLKVIIGTSEKIFDKYQAEVKRAFGQKIVSEYGSAEAGIIAFECPSGNMHVNMETAIVEEVDDQIIVTNLVSKSFPIIRYALGDYIKLGTTKTCACGMHHHIINEVLGRVGKLIHGFKEQYPSLTLYYVFKNLAITHHLIVNYQAIQRKKGFLEVNLDNKLKDGDRALLDAEFLKYFGSDLAISVHEMVNLKSEHRKKADFISDL